MIRVAIIGATGYTASESLTILLRHGGATPTYLTALPEECGPLAATFPQFRDRFKLTVLLVEHRMRLVMNICEWITVMDFGQVLTRGLPDEVRTNRQVVEAYLGRQEV